MAHSRRNLTPFVESLEPLVLMSAGHRHHHAPRHHAAHHHKAHIMAEALTVTPTASNFAWVPLGQNSSLARPTFLARTSTFCQDVSRVPVLSDSAARIAYQTSKFLGTEWGVDYPVGSGTPWGMPYVVVDASQPKVKVTLSDPYHTSDHDPGDPSHITIPIPANAQIESGNDHHAIVFDRDAGVFWELYHAAYSPATGWTAGAVATFNTVLGDDQRPEGKPSSTASGLPILPGLVTYDEANSGVINHALLMTVGGLSGITPNYFIPPARAFAGSADPTRFPLALPFGTRIRLSSSFDISGFSPTNQAILKALQTYGAILYDGGPAWDIQGAPDPRWNLADVLKLRTVPASALQVLDLNFGPGYVVTPPSGPLKVGVPSGPWTITLTGNLANVDLGVYPIDDQGIRATPYAVHLTTANPTATFAYTPKLAGTRTLTFTNPYVGRQNPAPITIQVSA